MKFLSFFIQVTQYLNTLSIKKLCLEEPFSFQSHSAQSTTSQSSVQCGLNSPQNGWCSFIFHHPTCLCPYISHQKSLRLLQPIFASLYSKKTIPTIPTKTPFLNISSIFRLPVFTYSHPYSSHQTFSPTVQSVQAASRVH